MKRLLLSSSNIKPVNIRIVSNGIQCADLKMLKENFCLSDVKNVLDGRLVNWLNNIGEKELATKVNELYSSPSKLNGKEYNLCELFFRDLSKKDYIQILFKEKDDSLFSKEINRIPNLLVEAYNYCPTKYPIVQWKTFFDESLESSDEFQQIKVTIAQKVKQSDDKIKNQRLKDDSEERAKFNKFLIEFLYRYVNYRNTDWRFWAKQHLKSCKLNEIYCKYGEEFILSVENSNLSEWDFRNRMKKFLKDNNLTDIKI